MKNQATILSFQGKYPFNEFSLNPLRCVCALRRVLCFIAVVSFFQCYSFSQWPTSTYADTSLFACFGFEPNIITFEDGSSIISGMLEDYIYATKLDENGYRVWPDQVQALFHNNSDLYKSPDLISDGDGGVILLWEDHRGATYSDDHYINNALYMQRIDKEGNVRWQYNGLEIEPAYTGRKYCYATTDGAGGFVLAGADIDNSVSPIKSKTWARRYNGDGNLLWERYIDSATAPVYASVGKVTRLGFNIIVSSSPTARIIDTSGNVSLWPQAIQTGSFITERDSVLFWIGNTNISDTLNDSIFVYLLIIKYTANFDTLWSNLLRIYDEGQYGTGNQTPFMADGCGGIFFVRSVYDDENFFRTRIYHIDMIGKDIWPMDKVFLPNFIPRRSFKDGNGGIVLYNFFGHSVIRYNYHGEAVWNNQPIIVINDDLNAYFPIVRGDNRGGAIVAFWRTYGGIWVKHSGRNGKVGIITNIQIQEGTPSSYILSQNYPNPFNPSTTIQFEIPHKTKVHLVIYDITGKLVQNIIDDEMIPGKFQVNIDLSDFSSGIYFYKMITDDFVATRKMLLMK